MKQILFISLLTCLSFSCKDEVVSTIPNAPTDLTLHLNDIDKNLWNICEPQIYTLQNRNGHTVATDRFGYGGILIINTGTGQSSTFVNLIAYDLACPVEAQSDIRVKPDSTGLKAVCSKCGAVYNIISNGAPISGSRYYLRQYRVTSNSSLGSDSYRVTN